MVGTRGRQRGRLWPREFAAAVVVVSVFVCLTVRAEPWRAGRTGPSLDDDLLLPYPAGSPHGARVPLRVVRQCQPGTYGNVTHEAWPAHRPGPGVAHGHGVITHQFVSDIKTSDGAKKFVYGHWTVVEDPARTLSVLEPGGDGGCSDYRRETVAETAETRRCLVSANAGFFRPYMGRCLGNIVSDGRSVLGANGVRNANFGIRRDGTIVTGYLSDDEAEEEEEEQDGAEQSPWLQLVSGVVWLLRNGSIYINESRVVECGDTQETGTFDRFISVVSARTAVGHDREGRVVLVQIDGQTDARGVNLWEFAAFLQAHGVMNAVNLDGGGSATLVLNGTLANYPSDHCAEDPMWRCARRVSTVLCVHEPACAPPGCGEHGECVAGLCRCRRGWVGAACDALLCGAGNCSGRGICTEDGCVCDAGWMGENCTTDCPKGWFGGGCAQRCACAHGATCDPVSGRCGCARGFHGAHCDAECPPGLHGSGCTLECNCSRSCTCDAVTGNCTGGALPSSVSKVCSCLAQQAVRQGAAASLSRLATDPWFLVSSALAVLAVLLMLGIVLQWLGPARCRRAHGPERYEYHALVPTANGRQAREEEVSTGDDDDDDEVKASVVLLTGPPGVT
ncbi:N-acetylglucosamine-1-phosphodiester alpha-N-acetylglucosaminidase isoform X2 [Petromyzon marinus]|uniref:N-acetylglucosamine-1-phosphodiester alpha-N-acetylglucosaminidase isoform X2 n=1 Tax=Petromyzon marinus TaxID=7757 RepID=UPI003F6FD05D